MLNALVDRWLTLRDAPHQQCKPTCSFLGLGHQLVVLLESQQHGLPLGSHLKRQIFLERFKQCRNVSASHCGLEQCKRPHIARGVHHGFAPVQGLGGAGTHGFRPGVVELASHGCLVAASWPEREVGEKQQARG